MKKLILLILVLSFFELFAQNDKYDLGGKLTKAELIFIKKRFNWIEENYLIINYRQPKTYCHYNQYRKVNSSMWFENYFSELKLQNTRVVYSYFESKLARKKIDNKDYFEDQNKYLFNRFFNKIKSCYAVLVINKNGEFQHMNGEYYKEDILRLIDKTKK